MQSNTVEEVNTMIKISMTIVAYNNYNDIKNAIDSIELYTQIQKKIYIVDNGCSVCKKEDIEDFKSYIMKYSDIEYLEMKSNLGFGKGHNFVIDKLNSQYHAIINPDILLKEDSFGKIIDYMDKDSEVGMCIPKIVDENGNRQDVYRLELTIFDMIIRRIGGNLFLKRKALHTMQNADYTKPFQVPFGQGSFLVIRTNIFKQLNGFDDKYFMYLEDADLCKRLNTISKLMYYPYTEVIHKWERGSHKNIKLFGYHLKSMKYYFDKWGYKFW